ncbi:VI polysaccharide biosynthesis protein [Rodentibacter ratti]|uniref:VI polysaccharide biosynthesis protein n=1 Tax=Rodentibacter ratti TaxID=1906745 RepID=A0A1V3KVW8_9PAST|nr:glycosyltransferase [Rodentibacter ratti]OOF81827.1 VI polysaccharide biosynthesis protein [Rodentibacter ratti]
MKRILVYGMTDNLGGMEAYIHNIYQHLDKDKIQFDFVCDFPSMTFSDFYLKNGCKIHYIPPKNKGLFRSLWEMYKVIKKENYETVYFNIMNAGYVLNMLPALLLRKKIVAHSHNAGTTKKILHYLLRWLLNKLSDIKLACSEKAGVFMYGENEKYQVIKNGIDLDKYTYSKEKYTSIRQKLEWNENPVILYVARMNHQKNPFFALEIMQALNKEIPNMMMVYVGDGELKKDIEKYISERNIKNISFMGIRDDVNQLMIASDILILPSLFEGLPIVAVEAQAAGLPTLLSDNVSKEAKLVSSTEFLSIDNVSLWSNRVISILNNKDNQRASDATALDKNGYNVISVSRFVQKILLG